MRKLEHFNLVLILLVNPLEISHAFDLAVQVDEVGPAGYHLVGD